MTKYLIVVITIVINCSVKRFDAMSPNKRTKDANVAYDACLKYLLSIIIIIIIIIIIVVVDAAVVVVVVVVAVTAYKIMLAVELSLSPAYK